LRVFGIIALASLPLTILAAVNLWQSVSEAQERVSSERVALARSAAQTVSQVIQGDVTLLRGLARTQEVRGGDRNTAIAPFLSDFLVAESNIAQLALFDADGWNLALTEPSAPPRSMNVADREFFQLAIRSGVAVSSRALTPVETASPILVVSAAVDFDSGRRGVLTGSLSVRDLRDDLRSFLEEGGLSIVVVDSAGQVIIDAADDRPGPGVSLRGQPAVDAALNGESGSRIVADGTDEELLVAYAPVPTTDWAILIEQPAALAFDVARGDLTSGLGVFIIAALIAVAIGAYFGTRLSESYERERLARAESERATQAVREITAESEQRRRFLERLIASAPIAIGITRGPEHRFVSVNPRYQSLKPGVEMTGRPIREVFPEIVPMGVIDRLDEVYKSGTQATAVDQLRNFGRIDDEGPERYFTIVYAPYDDVHGHVEGVLIIALETSDMVRARLRAEREKDVFLSTASHELKTPLTALALSAQMIERLLNRGSVDDERLRRSVAGITRQVHRANELINDLLEVSRLQLGTRTFRCEPLDFALLVRQVVERTRDVLPDGTGHEIITAFGDAPVTIKSDEARLDQVLTNLLSNAVKYSPDGGRIDVHLNARADDVELQVVDHGMGVPPGEDDVIFLPFSRATTARDSSIEGTGLGLYITKQTVESLGGSIRYEPTPGGGATFIVELPRLAELTPPDAAVERRIDPAA
jgi:signal transduction histidine kinase